VVAMSMNVSLCLTIYYLGEFMVLFIILYPFDNSFASVFNIRYNICHIIA